MWLTLPIFLALIVGFFVPVLSYFRFLFVLPAFYLLVSSSSQKRLVYLLVVLNLLFSGIYLFTPKFQREDWRGAVSFIETNSSKNSQVIFPANSQMEAYRYYATKNNFSGPDGLGQNSDEIWLMRYVQGIVDPADSTRYKIEELDFEKTEEYNFNGILVFRYVKRLSQLL
jgi:hypothetical protein